MTKKMQIIVDDGRVRVPIVNNSGDEVGHFYFVPTDVNLLTRYNKVADEIADVVAPLNQLDIGPGGSASDADTEKALQESADRLYKLIDYLFDADASGAFFGRVHPFSPVGGNFYCLRVFESVGAFIKDQFAAESKQISKALSKYTAPYEA